MAYQATVIPVMIASPGDVSEERDIIRSVIYDWNDVNAATSKLMLAPMSWETHSSPELGARAQELINTRILKNCDLLVGVFWTRLGTPTGMAKSGTVEEIDEHIASGKPAMIYFSSKPVAPESLNPEQYAEVQAFKEKCKTNGLVFEFENTEQFKTKFAKQLPLCLAHNPYIKSLVNQLAEPQTEITQELKIPQRTLTITEEAKTILKAAASRSEGTIIKIVTHGGRGIQAGGQSFGGESSRESAKWEAALNELVSLSLVVDRGYKGEVFELTHQGWEIADKLL